MTAPDENQAMNRLIRGDAVGGRAVPASGPDGERLRSESMNLLIRRAAGRIPPAPSPEDTQREADARTQLIRGGINAGEGRGDGRPPPPPFEEEFLDALLHVRDKARARRGWSPWITRLPAKRKRREP